MKHLGIDYGSAHVGVAIGDNESRVATPYETIHKKDQAEVIQALQLIIDSEEIEAIVIGFPIGMDGKAGGQAKATQKFIEQLQQVVTIPIHKEDERMTSQLAQKLLKDDHDRSQEHAVAAASILQSFLDRMA